MRTGKIILAAVFLTAATSCVSGRKYKEAVSERAKLEQQYSDEQQKYMDLDASYSDLKGENERLKTANNVKEASLTDQQRKLLDKENNLKELQALIDEEKEAISNLKQEVCSALKCFTPEELKVEVRDGKLYVSMSDKLLFPSGSDKVNDRGIEAIQALSTVLANSNLEIMVEGNTDSVPIKNAVNKDNWDLSVRRATSVTRIMIDDGVNPARIIASGRGKYYPVASNESANGRQLNRRTDIVLAPRLDKLWKLTQDSQSSAMK